MTLLYQQLSSIGLKLADYSCRVRPLWREGDSFLERTLRWWWKLAKCVQCNGTGLCKICKGQGKSGGISGWPCKNCEMTGKCPRCGGKGGYWRNSSNRAGTYPVPARFVPIYFLLLIPNYPLLIANYQLLSTNYHISIWHLAFGI
jgi:hypothetical protein